MKKMLLLVMVVAGLFGAEYKCVSTQKQENGVMLSWKFKDKLLVIEDKYKVKIAITDGTENATGTCYNTGEKLKVGKNNYKKFKNSDVTVYVSEDEIKNGIYLITIKTPGTMEGFACTKSNI